MRRILPFIGAILIATPAPLAAASFDALWPPSRQTEGAWAVVTEAPERVSDDPDLLEWGVVARETRHYTRSRGRRVEVCSIELWEFAREAQAAAAHGGFAFPDWQIDRHGTLLVMLHSRVWAPGTRARREVFAACRTLGASVLSRARAARMGREGGGNP